MYIGHAEINSFAEVGEIEKFADDYSVIKKDCIGQTQKRMWQHSRFTKVRTVVRNYLMARPLKGKADLLTILWIASKTTMVKQLDLTLVIQKLPRVLFEK